jgi:diguanylate cyclase (GGDEF)-like protein
MAVETTLRATVAVWTAAEPLDGLPSTTAATATAAISSSPSTTLTFLCRVPTSEEIALTSDAYLSRCPERGARVKADRVTARRMLCGAKSRRRSGSLTLRRPRADIERMDLVPGRHGRFAVPALGAIATVLVLAGLGAVAIDGPARVSATGDARHVLVCAIAAAILWLRVAMRRSERGVWVAFAVGVSLFTVSDAIWAFVYDTASLSPASGTYVAGYVAFLTALALFLRRRIGDAYRTLWFDAVGIAISVTAISTAIVLPLATAGRPDEIAGNALITGADVGIWSVVLASASLGGQKAQRQTLALSLAFVAATAADAAFSLHVAGFLGEIGGALNVGWEIGLLLIAAAAWLRPTPAGQLRIGGWWEVVPTLSWLVAGTGVLLAAAITPIPPFAIAFAVAACAAAAWRGARITRDMRGLVVHRAQALTDPLTGLGNRPALLQALELVTRDRGRSGERAALLLIDLDGFKEANDTLGHVAGDALLAEIGRRLDSLAAWAYRTSGDEFAVLARATDDPHELAHGLLALIAEPIQADGVTLSMLAGIGIARYPEDARAPQELLRRADVALRDAKARRAGIGSYLPARDGHSRDRLTLAADLRAAFAQPDGGGLWVAFQPQVDLLTGRAEGAEALIRWQHPVRGAIAPAQLLPLAVRIGLLGKLTDWVVERSLEAAAAWSERGHDLRVSVNVSAVTLADEELPSRIGAALDRHEVDPRRLVVELTEDAIMSEPETALAAIAALRELGVSIALDDFGTGHSSLAQLRRIAATELKIDRSFVLAMGRDRFDREIVHVVVDLARRLGMRIVAEGIEDLATWQALGELGCGVGQGFGIARPMPADALAQWLARGGRAWPGEAPGEAAPLAS